MNIPLSQLARCIDQTNLNPTASAAEVHDFARQAIACRFRAVAVMLSWVPLVTSVLHGSETTVVAPVGFPLGSGTTAAKVGEAQWALQHGPRDIEIDMVM